MSKKKKQIIIIATVLLLCIAVVTTVVLITRNSGRKQEDQTMASVEARGEEQTDGRNEGEDPSEHATSSSDSTERKTELAEGSITEEAQKPAESESMANGSKPTGGTTNNNVPQTTTQSTTQAPASPTTQAPTTQSPTTTEQPSGGNGGNTHQHTWEAQYRTVHHDEEGHYENVCVKEAYDEPIYEGHYFCDYCGKDITASGEGPGHCIACGPPYPPEHPLYGQFETQGSGYGTVRVQVGTTHHEAVYEKKWIVDKKAYDEQVSNGYKCTTCGATK